VSRILHHHAPLTPRWAIRAAAGTTAAVLLALAVAACGSSSTNSTDTAVLGSAAKQNCTSIADVLSDGPDPDSDPVGYAQAQVLPLRQLSIANATLHRDVLSLADAFETFSTGSKPGGTAAALKVSNAEEAVNSICPEAAP
jgi:hypothetical protein